MDMAEVVKVVRRKLAKAGYYLSDTTMDVSNDQVAIGVQTPKVYVLFSGLEPKTMKKEELDVLIDLRIKNAASTLKNLAERLHAPR